VNPAFANPGFMNPGFANPAFANPAFANQAFNGFNNGFNGFNGTAFDPNLAFNNGFNNGFTSGFDPALTGNPFFNGFNNGFNGFNNGFAAAPLGFGGFPYGGYGGPVDLSPYGGMNGLPGFNPVVRASGTPGRSPVVPVLGINTPAPRPPGRIYASGQTRVDTTPKTPEDFAARRLIPDQDTVASRAGAADQTDVDTGTGKTDNGGTATAEIRRTPATPDQTRLASRAQEIMANRPMREGLVVSIDGGTVDVTYTCDGKSRQDTFPAGEVFFFRTSGALATAANANGALHIGDRVLVACETEQPRQAVAGSRQEMRSSDMYKSPPGMGSATTGSATTRRGTTRRVKPQPHDRNGLGE